MGANMTWCKDARQKFTTCLCTYEAASQKVFVKLFYGVCVFAEALTALSLLVHVVPLKSAAAVPVHDLRHLRDSSMSTWHDTVLGCVTAFQSLLILTPCSGALYICLTDH